MANTMRDDYELPPDTGRTDLTPVDTGAPEGAFFNPEEIILAGDFAQLRVHFDQIGYGEITRSAPSDPKSMLVHILTHMGVVPDPDESTKWQALHAALDEAEAEYVRAYLGGDAENPHPDRRLMYELYDQTVDFSDAALFHIIPEMRAEFRDRGRQALAHTATEAGNIAHVVIKLALEQ